MTSEQFIEALMLISCLAAIAFGVQLYLILDSIFVQLRAKTRYLNAIADQVELQNKMQK